MLEPGETLDIPVLPNDQFVTESAILARRRSIAAELVLTGNQYFLADADANANDTAGNCYLAAASPDRCWAMYRFENLVVADDPDLLTIELDTLPAEYIIAWSDYGTDSWAWTHIITPSGEDSITLPTGVEPVSPGGNVYALVAVTDNRQATVNSVKLALDAAAPPPVGLQASDGTRGDMVQLGWTDPAVAYPGLSYTGVKVYRAEDPRGPWMELGEVATGVTAYDDIHEGTGVGQNNVLYNQPVYYRLRTVTDTITGAPGLSYAGLRVLDDVTGLSATDGEHYDKVVITWSYARDDANGYEVEYKETSEGAESWTVLAQVSGYANQSFEHTDISPTGMECAHNVSYDYRVRAYYLDDYSTGFSDTDSGYRLVQPPTDLQATDEAYPDKIVLTWTKSTGASNYKIYRDGQAETELIATVGDVDTYSDTSIPDYDSHSYYLQATTPSGESTLVGPANGKKIEWLHGIVMWSASGVCSISSLHSKPIVSFRYYNDGANSAFFARATSANPLDTPDWVAMKVLDLNNITHTSVAVVGEKPAMACYQDGNERHDLYYTRSTTAEPTLQADWVQMDVETTDDVGRYCRLIEYNGKPVIAYWDNTNQDLKIAIASSAEPSASTDWSIHVVDDAGGAYIDLDVISGMLCIAYCSAGNLAYARATTTTPTSSEDWVVINPIETAARWASLAVLDGKPAVSYYDSANENLKFARSTTAEPNDAGDWLTMTVDDQSLSVGEYSTIAVVNGVPCIAYFMDGSGSASRWKFAIAPNSSPVSSDTWHIHTPLDESGERGKYIQMDLMDGYPVLVYQYDSGNGLLFARWL